MVNLDDSTLVGVAAIFNAMAAIIGALRGWKR